MKILVVEDEPQPREGLCDLLRKTSRDWELLPPSASGVEGVLAVEALRPDLVITDIRMPDLDGLGMIEAFQKAGSRPKVIVLSGYPDFEYARKCLSLGVKEYLLKPSTASSMIEAVRQVEDEHWSDGDLADSLNGKATLETPGLLFLVRTSGALTLGQKKALRQEISGLTGNPHGTLVAEFPSNQIFFFAKKVFELSSTAVGNLLVTLKQRLHTNVVGAALLVPLCSTATREVLVSALKRFLLKPTPGFLWGFENPDRFLPVAYPFAVEKELVGLLGTATPGSFRRCLERVCSDIFKVGFDPEESVVVTQRLFSSLEKRIEALDTAKFSAVHALAPASLVEAAMDYNEIETIFATIATVFETDAAVQEPKAENVKIQSALTMIEKRLNSPPTLAECASELGMSAEYLSRLFKSQMATGFAKYVMTRRIELAKGHIASSSATIQQISSTLGFQNAKYFCAIFRKETGLTPTEYRARFVQG